VDKEFAEKLISLDERRCANDIAFAIGRWGISWVFEVCIEVFQEIDSDEERSCCDKAKAQKAILLFESFKNYFQ
jgi:hypothetical protein